MTTSAIVLAAGKGTRMRSDLPKPLHDVCGRPLLAWVLDAFDAVELAEVAVVVGHGRDEVVASLEHHFPTRRFRYAEQLAQRGTGDATAVGLAELEIADPGYDDEDDVIVVPGDTPLLRAETILQLVAKHRVGGAACTMITARVPDPTGYGRILRDGESVAAIVEHRDATEDQRAIDEINAGMFCFRRSLLAPALRMISGDNAQGELYLTDVIGILTESGHRVAAHEADPVEISGVNDRAQLGAVAAVIGARIVNGHMAAGVTVVQPSSTVIEAGATIEPDVVIHPATVIEGSTTIASGAVIGPGSRLTNATVGADTVVEASTVRDAFIADHAVVGPYEVVHGDGSAAR